MRTHTFICLLIAIVILLVPMLGLAQADPNAPPPADPNANGILLLQPIGGTNRIPVGEDTQGVCAPGENVQGLGPLFCYVSLLYPWLVGVGAAVALLHGVWGGIEIIQAGGDSGGLTKGRNRLLLSLTGLLIILFSATILNALNPSFYK